MCNLYSLRKGQAAILDISRAMRDLTGNLPPMPGIYPDYPVPIVRTGMDGVGELAMARWGMPSSKRAILRRGTRSFQVIYTSTAHLDGEVPGVSLRRERVT